MKTPEHLNKIRQNKDIVNIGLHENQLAFNQENLEGTTKELDRIVKNYWDDIHFLSLRTNEILRKQNLIFTSTCIAVGCTIANISIFAYYLIRGL